MERLITFQVSENTTQVGPDIKSKVSEVVKSLEHYGILQEGDEIYVNLQKNQAVFGGELGRCFTVEDVFRDEDGSLVDSVKNRYTMDRK